MEGQLPSANKALDDSLPGDDAQVSCPQSAVRPEGDGDVQCDGREDGGDTQNGDGPERHGKTEGGAVVLSFATLPLTALMDTRAYLAGGTVPYPKPCGKYRLGETDLILGLLCRCVEMVNISGRVSYTYAASNPHADKHSDVLLHLPTIVENMARGHTYSSTETDTFHMAGNSRFERTIPDYSIDDRFLSLFGPLPPAYVLHCIRAQGKSSRCRAAGIEWYDGQKGLNNPGRHFNLKGVPHFVRNALLKQTFWFREQSIAVQHQILWLSNMKAFKGLESLMRWVDTIVYPSFFSVVRKWTWETVRDRWRAVTAALLKTSKKSLRIQEVQAIRSRVGWSMRSLSCKEGETDDEPKTLEGVTEKGEDPFTFLREDVRQLLSLPRDEPNTLIRKALFTQGMDIATKVYDEVSRTRPFPDPLFAAPPTKTETEVSTEIEVTAEIEAKAEIGAR